MAKERKIMERSAVFEALKKRGAAKAVVSFSGGGDEGGCDGIQLLDAAGAVIAEIDEYYGNTTVWDPDTQTYKDIGPPNEEQQMSEGLCVPVYEKYHSFAGEFSVSGTVTWDVATRKVTMSGEESVEQYEPFEEEA